MIASSFVDTCGSSYAVSRVLQCPDNDAKGYRILLKLRQKYPSLLVFPEQLYFLNTDRPIYITSIDFASLNANTTTNVVNEWEPYYPYSEITDSEVTPEYIIKKEIEQHQRIGIWENGKSFIKFTSIFIRRMEDYYTSGSLVMMFTDEEDMLKSASDAYVLVDSFRK